LAIAALTGLGTAGVLLTGFLESDRDDRVILEIEYYDKWEAIISDGTSNTTLSGYGRTQSVLMRPRGDVWTLSATVRKIDQSTCILYLRVKLMDGTVLRQAATSEPYGKAYITLTIE
jgi:hypothetical protein